MKIAIPTNDKTNIAKRTGRAQWFAVYEVSEKKIISTDYRKNTHEHHDHSEGGEHEHSHTDLVESLIDCDMVLLMKVGVHLKNDFDKGGISYTKVTGEKLTEILAEYLG